MRRDYRAYLWEVREAADAIASFMQGRSFEDNAADLMFRSAVEHQLAIIGEALSQLARVDQGLAARIPELHRVIVSRNVLIHGYDQIDDAAVWRIVEADFAPLRLRVAALLGELGEPWAPGVRFQTDPGWVRRRMALRHSGIIVPLAPHGRSRRTYVPSAYLAVFCNELADRYGRALERIEIEQRFGRSGGI